MDKESGPFRKNLEQTSVFDNAKNEEQRSQLFYDIYIILKPNESDVNEATRSLLQRIESLVPDKCESDLHGQHLSERNCMTKFGFTKGRLYRLDGCKENPVSIKEVINSTYPPPSRIDRPSPETDESSGIECDISTEPITMPSPLNLLSALKVPVSISSSEVLCLCRSSKHLNNIFEDAGDAAILPDVPRKVGVDCLKPKVSLIYVKNRADAMSDALKQKCLESSICVIRDIVHALNVNLTKFTTKEIESIAQDYVMDLREQWSMKEEKNENGKSWFYPSFRYRTNVATYSKYQADSFALALKEGNRILKKRQSTRDDSDVVESSRRSIKKRKRSSLVSKKNRIYFGTNVDFSEPIFEAQVAELQKLPPFCRLADEENFLSHLGYDLKGMNTAQFYMKRPGCKTPAHLENNSFCSVNLNIGPGDCEWFGVSYEFYPLLDQLCKRKGLDFLKDSWWPDYDELISAGIPVYRFIQKSGDLVWISGGCVHWVEARGWCNNIAWNVGPSSVEQFKLNLLSTEFNRTRLFESLIPMQHLSWNIAKNCEIQDPELHDLIRGVLIRSLAYCQMVANYVQGELNMPIEPLQKGIEMTTTVCSKCKAEVFNIVFAYPITKSLTTNSIYDTYCLHCAKSTGFKDVEVWRIHNFKYLCEILDRF